MDKYAARIINYSNTRKSCRENLTQGSHVIAVTKTGNDHKPLQTSKSVCKPPVKDHELPTSHHKPPANDQKSPTNNHKQAQTTK